MATDTYSQWNQGRHGPIPIASGTPDNPPITPLYDLCDGYLASPSVFLHDEPFLHSTPDETWDGYGYAVSPCTAPESIFSFPDDAAGYGWDISLDSPASPSSSSTASDGHWRRSGSEAASLPRLRTSGERASAKAQATKRSVVGKGKPPSRTNHNQVEKKYRDRLNDQFERLLAVLVSKQDEDEDTVPGPLSKGAVLGLARRRMLALQGENRRLAAKVERLSSHFQRGT